MIIVVEGISASGKTAWCAQHDAMHVVPEIGRLMNAPDYRDGSIAAAAFWEKRSAERWHSALVMERETGLAICDTDPLKTHYAWGLWQIGAAPEHSWRHSLAATRQSFCEGRVGFADIYFVKKIHPEIARRQRDRDPTRARRNFELHLRLQPPLIAWYEALGAVLPGRVQFGLPDTPICCADAGPNGMRYDVALFDRAMSLLQASLSNRK